MSDSELGGDPACWSHLFVTDEDSAPHNSGLVVDLGSVALGSGGAIWSLPHGGDLDANLVRLDPEGAIGAHVNNDVDVLMFVQSGAGEVEINGVVRRVAADHVVLIPKGAQRSIRATTAGLTYLSVHRRRSPLTIKPIRPGRPTS